MHFGKQFLGLIVAACVLDATGQPTTQTSPAPSCKVAFDEQKLKATELKYAALMKQVTDDTRNKSKKIEDEGSRTDITGHIETRRLDFALDVPEIRMVDQRLSMDVPETRMKTQTWSWDMIEIRMVRQCRAGPDEIVVENKTCHNDFPPFDYPCPETRTRRGADICWDEPRSETVRQEIKLDIPEFTMKRIEWVMGVPEFKMVTQRFAFDYPVVIIDSIQTRSEKAKQDSRQLSDDTKRQTQSIATAMKAEMGALTKAPMLEAFVCQERQLRTAMRATWDKLGETSASIAEGLNKARASKSAPAVAAFEAAQKDFQAKQKAVIENYVKMRRDLAAKKRQVLTQL